MTARRVLAVDDSKTMRNMVTLTLERAGFEVTEAEDGEDALSKLRATQFDLVITDINMPRVDGITLVRTVRAEDTNRGVPILLLTTEHVDWRKSEGKSAGATGWIVKPFEPDRLVEVANKVCP